MLDWIVAIAVAFSGTFGFVAFDRWRRAQRRALAATPPADETVIRVAEGRPTRLYVDRNLPTGAKAGLVNLTGTTLVLTDVRLILATHHGKVLESTARKLVAFRCVGPRRLVAEGVHPDGITNVRLEIIVEDPEQWVADVEHTLGSLAPAQSNAVQ